MKHKIYIAILLCGLFSLPALNGQVNVFKRNIEWQENIRFYNPYRTDDDPEYFLLKFKNCIYTHESHDLPVYNELMPVNKLFDVSIENQKYTPIDGAELKMLAGLKDIKPEISISVKLVYIRKKKQMQVNFVPIRKNPISGQIEKLVEFELKLKEKAASSLKNKKSNTYAQNSVLSNGKWIKIKIDKSGVYKINFSDLLNLGISNPQNIRIFGNGGKMLPEKNNEKHPDDLTENKIIIRNNAVYFYAEGPTNWIKNEPDGFFRQQKHLYSESSWYFLSSDYNPATNNLIETQEQSIKPFTHQINTYTDYGYHEVDSTNLIQSGKLWVGEKFDFETSYAFSFNFPNLMTNSEIRLESSLLARSPINSTFSIEINNQTYNSVFPAVSYNYTSTFASHKIEKFTGNSGLSSAVSVKFTYNKSTASSEAWLDYLTINVKRNLAFGSEQLHFRNTESVGNGNVGLFSLAQANAQTEIWEITDKQKPKKVNATLNGSVMDFKLDTDSLREFVAFNESMVYTPIIQGEGVGVVENQNLHSLNGVDMVIVCHPEFYEQAKQLEQIHEETDQLTVEVVKNQQVYNEFSSGMPDPSAIRNLMKMLYDRATNDDEMPKYLCLFGDGSYDNKRPSQQNTNFVLTYQSANSLSPTLSFVTDDFFGFLDDDEGGNDGLLDIGIGRIPVKNKTEATNAINKIKNYLSLSSYGDWRNRICFVADDEDYNLHVAQADELSTIVKNNYPVFNIEKVYLDAFVQQSSSSGQRYPDANRSIDNLIAKGLLLFNYTGHGNERWLAEENIFSTDQIQKYQNLNKLMLIMTATCEFSRFDNYNMTTAGEHAFLNPSGAAIALFSTTRLVYASPNFELNKCFYDFIFESNPETNKNYAFGDVMMLTKNASGTGINKLNFTLLGDPALKLSYANLKVMTKTINNNPANGVPDTLKAFQKISIIGEIQNQSGEKIEDYNGLIYPIVFDKKQTVKTLDNDGEGSFTYSVVNSQVFKGKASVTNGNFQFSFIVPKDIRYNIDSGRISYYANNYQLLEDAKGQFGNFMIGGISNQGKTDDSGPQIKLYLNDENFVNGGITDKTPRLLVHLSDSSGINTTGGGIGHDLVATIDNNPDLKFVVNDYYESEQDDYTKGQIHYNLPELKTGEHKLHLKAWDVYNNSSEDSIVFHVTENLEFTLSHVLNYPNPFSTHTQFFFEHNRPNELLDILIQVYTVSGRIIKTINTEQITDGYRSAGIAWDGKDDNGNKPGRGVYFYKLSVKTPQGERSSKMQKLLILN